MLFVNISWKKKHNNVNNKKHDNIENKKRNV